MIRLFYVRPWRAALTALLSIVVSICFSLRPADAENLSVTPKEAEGRPVAAIRFYHLAEKPIADEKLRAAMRTHSGKHLRRRFFRNDLETIENLYRSAGFMDVSIPDRRLTIDARGDVRIGIDIDSGAKWKVASVEVVPADSLELPDLPGTRRLRPGRTFRYARMREDERALQTSLNRQGYADARVSPHLHLDSKTKEATVRYLVTRGRKFYFGPVAVQGIRGNSERSLKTRPEIISRALTFREGDLYDPAEVSRSRNNLARTDLFRSVIFRATVAAENDSAQNVRLLLEESKYLHLGGRFTMEGRDARLSGNIQHRNWRGRGSRVGTDASIGQPSQGATVYVTERHLIGGADFTLSSGVSEEWGQSRVGVAAQDQEQRLLLAAADPLLRRLLADDETAAADRYLRQSSYRFRSIERIWNANAILQRSWEPERGLTHLVRLSLQGAFARSRPTGQKIDFKTSRRGLNAAATALGNPTQAQQLAVEDLPLDRVWKDVLTDRSRTINLNLTFERDSRDNQFAPRRGSFFKAGGLTALQIGGQATRVLDGILEFRYYQPVGSNLVFAQGVTLVQAASLPKERNLPQTYWKEFGGEGSVRGVPRQSIQAVGGGRTGFNLRSELRAELRDFGLVAFWDRAEVWRHTKDVGWNGMADGYGIGWRYTIGFPLRFDLGTDDGFKSKRYYFSIGQAF